MREYLSQNPDDNRQQLDSLHELAVGCHDMVHNNNVFSDGTAPCPEEQKLLSLSGENDDFVDEQNNSFQFTIGWQQQTDSDSFTVFGKVYNTKNSFESSCSEYDHPCATSTTPLSKFTNGALHIPHKSTHSSAISTGQERSNNNQSNTGRNTPNIMPPQRKKSLEKITIEKIQGFFDSNRYTQLIRLLYPHLKVTKKEFLNLMDMSIFGANRSYNIEKLNTLERVFLSNGYLIEYFIRETQENYYFWRDLFLDDGSNNAISEYYRKSKKV